MTDTADSLVWETLIPQMATDIFCGHWDSYAPTKNNFTFHVDDEDRLSLITGGADQAFDPAHEVTVENAQGRLFVRCREDPACAAAVDTALIDVAADVQAWLDGGGRARLATDAATLQGHFADDTRREWDHRQIPTLTTGLLGYIDGRVTTFSAP
jgi:hypothetical protein